MPSGHRRLLAAAVSTLAALGVACSNAGPAPVPSAPQQQSAAPTATVIPVQPSPVPSTASEPTSTPRPAAAPAANTGTATVQPVATAQSTKTAERATSSPVPTATSAPATLTPLPPSPTPETSAPSNAIISSKIEDFKFEDLEVSMGTIVSWFNKDGVPHTVTAGSFKDPQPAVFNSGAFSKGEQYSFVFHDAGSFKFYCVFHPRMEGTITVLGNP